MSEIFSFEKSSIGELRDLLPGTDDFDFGTSPAKPVLMFGLTEEQRSHLAFAAKCEAEELAECYEADQLEVQEAVGHLWEAYKVLNGGRYE